MRSNTNLWFYICISLFYTKISNFKIYIYFSIFLHFLTYMAPENNFQGNDLMFIWLNMQAIYMCSYFKNLSLVAQKLWEQEQFQFLGACSEHMLQFEFRGCYLRTMLLNVQVLITLPFFKLQGSNFTGISSDSLSSKVSDSIFDFLPQFFSGGQYILKMTKNLKKKNLKKKKIL